MLTAGGLRAAFVTKVSPQGRLVWVVQSGEGPFTTLGELALGRGSVTVLGRYAGTANLGRFPITSARATDYFLARLPAY